MLGFWLKALAAPTLDLSLTTHAGLETRIVERPGEMLDDQDLTRLVEQLRAVAGRTLPQGSLTYGVFSGERERLARTVVTVITERETGKPIAFNALARMPVALHGEPQEVIHLGLVMIDPDERGRGLSWVLYGLTVLLLFVKGGLRPRWVSNVTQVPSVVGMVCQTFSEVYPSPDPGARQSFTHLTLARAIMRDHRHVFGVGPEAGFDEERSVITNAYTGGSDDLKKSLETAPKHREERYNTFCGDQLDYDRGDDVLQVGRMDLAAARRYLFGQVPRTSLPGLAGATAFLLLRRLVLPIVHWLDDGRRFGSLRPRDAKGKP